MFVFGTTLASAPLPYEKHCVPLGLRLTVHVSSLPYEAHLSNQYSGVCCSFFVHVPQKCVSKVLYLLFHMLNIGSAVWKRIDSFLCYFFVKFYFELLYTFLSWVTLFLHVLLGLGVLKDAFWSGRFLSLWKYSGFVQSLILGHPQESWGILSWMEIQIYHLLCGFVSATYLARCNLQLSAFVHPFLLLFAS